MFDPVKFASLDGKTGPYILYTMVRIKSLLKKGSIENYKIETINNDDVRSILVKALELPRILDKAYQEATLNYITEYLYEIASLFNKFYNNYNVLKEDNISVRNSYLAISKLVYTICHNLLNILAIEEVDQM